MPLTLDAPSLARSLPSPDASREVVVPPKGMQADAQEDVRA
jgi:hypothetical protein